MMVAATLGGLVSYVYPRQRQNSDDQDSSLYPSNAEGEVRVDGRWTPPWAEGSNSLPSAEEAQFDVDDTDGQPEARSWRPHRQTRLLMAAACFALAVVITIGVVVQPKNGPMEEVNSLLGMAPDKQPGETSQGSIVLMSEAFADWGAIPARYTADGLDISPPLSWSNLPSGTRSLVLICDDPEAPNGDEWNHWVAYDIHPTLHGFAEAIPHKPEETTYDALEDGMVAFRQGLNSWANSYGWKGPDPPDGDGEHWYEFRLFAVDKETLGLDPEETTKDAVVNRLREKDIKILGYGALTGTYER